MDDKQLKTLGDKVQSKLKDAVTSVEVAFGELTLHVEREKIVEVARFLRDEDDYQFHILVDLCAVDYPDRAKRFDVVYHFLSLTRNARIRLKLQTNEDDPVPSIVEVHPCANWFEREAFDMCGVMFSGHPDLRRILTDYGFTGFPLRRDFPMTGYVECRWDEEQKRVVYQPVKLQQEFRTFDFLSPWEGTDYVLPGDEKAGS